MTPICTVFAGMAVVLNVRAVTLLYLFFDPEPAARLQALSAVQPASPVGELFVCRQRLVPEAGQTGGNWRDSSGLAPWDILQQRAYPRRYVVALRVVLLGRVKVFVVAPSTARKPMPLRTSLAI